MAYQVIEYMDENPDASLRDIFMHFSKELEIDDELRYLKKEVDTVLACREKLRPLYGKKMTLETDLTLFDSGFDMDVMVKYPPRQGSDKDRKAYKQSLQQLHPDYTRISKEVDRLKEEIDLIELEMIDMQQRAKNARRVLETFNQYCAFFVELSKSEKSIDEYKNANLF